MQVRNRAEVPAHQAFVARREELQQLDLQERFTRIYETNLWGSEVSRSGTGSADDQTARIRHLLPDFVRELDVKSILDVPCGDFAWMQHVDLGDVAYTGADIVPHLVARNQDRFGAQGNHIAAGSRRFLVLDLTADALPAVDLVFCRDCLVHLSFPNIWKVIANLQRSGSTWLLTTTFPAHPENEDIEDGDWRLLNFECAPFHFPPPITLLNEGCTEQDGKFGDKSLGLWRIANLPQCPRN
ncbi:MAG: class I SAM-dependent methyltransferase [Bryobacterales bacterium]|nr:class I SAM-dependent methyltransferase [Bryobacterales bacterium]